MSFDFSTLITDRAQSDLSYLKSLLSKPESQWTDAEREQFNLAVSKAAYNYTDLNRVTEAMTYLDGVLKQKGYKSGFESIKIDRGSVDTEQDPNTLLLLHGEDFLDYSKYSVLVTNNGVSISKEKSKFGGKSFYFDGSSDLAIKLSALGLDFNSDWTLEWWEYTPVNPGTTSAVICVPNGNFGFVVYSPQNEKIRIFAGQNGSWGVIPVTTIGTYSSNTWIHRAICKKNGTVYAFENGNLTATINFIGQLKTPKDILYIGYRDTTSNSGYFSGYLDEIRISNIARWTSDFIPPSEPYSNEISKKDYDPNTLLLLHGESVEDSSGYSVPITNSGVQVSDAQSKFGGKSLYFDGGSQIQFPQYEFSDQDFTIDWWEYCEDGAGDRFSLAYTVEQDKYGGLYLGYKGAGVSCSTQLNNVFDMIDQAMFDVVPGQWVHRAFVRHGNNFSSYKNGVLFSSVVASGKIAYDSTYKSSIGDHRLYDHSYFIGYMDEYRISNVARWTSDFIPPTEPYVVESQEEELDPYTWYESDSPTVSQMEGYIKNVVSVCSVFFNPELSEKLEYFTQDKANAIESALLELKNFIDRLELTPVPCGVATCGGDYL